MHSTNKSVCSEYTLEEKKCCTANKKYGETSRCNRSFWITLMYIVQRSNKGIFNENESQMDSVSMKEKLAMLSRGTLFLQ